MFQKILPHVCIVLSLVMLTFLIIDQVNSAMAFINNQGTKILMMIFCALVIALAVWAVREQRKRQ
jgi:hypothetical protein